MSNPSKQRGARWESAVVTHLRLLTNYENARRTSGRDWPLGRCVNGHPNSDLYQQPSGKFVCRSCRRVWTARYEAKKGRK